MGLPFAKHQHQGRLSKFIEMTVTIKYFGLIADVTETKGEVFISADAELTTQLLSGILLEKYEGLSQQSYAIAVNKKIITDNLKLSDNDTIALLPPFAGG